MSRNNLMQNIIQNNVMDSVLCF